MASSRKKRNTPAQRRRPARATPKPRPSVKRQATLPKFDTSAIVLTRTKGTPERGGGPGGEAWRIDAEGERAGVVFINMIDEPPIGRHASIQIYLNAKHQGRGIGRVGYQKACEASAYDEIYAHMRKANIASRMAAEAAGFVDTTPAGERQLLMVHRRAKS